MIRFSPDSWLEAVLRPVAMALPQSWIYTEIIAPDMRFLILIVLAVISMLARLFVRSAKPMEIRACILMLLVIFSFPLWLTIGWGNGRYYMPIILLVGVVMVAVWHSLPLRWSTKWVMMAVFLVMQFAALSANPPWRSFQSLEWVRWGGDDYFDLDTSKIVNDHGVTYVTLPGQSYSLVAPQFPWDARWINLTSFQGEDFLNAKSPVVREVKRRLQSAGDLRLFVRSFPRQANPVSGLPSDEARRILDEYVQAFGMRLSRREACKLLPSVAMQSMDSVTVISSSGALDSDSSMKAHAGFWVCPMEWAPVNKPSNLSGGADIERRVDQAFRKLESLCPRLFPPGQDFYRRTEYGYQRGYPVSESSMAYVRANELFYLKMERAMNPQLIGSVSEILAPDFRLDCGGFVGREGLPWLREI